jgi:hypothetical protein
MRPTGVGEKGVGEKEERKRRERTGGRERERKRKKKKDRHLWRERGGRERTGILRKCLLR